MDKNKQAIAQTELYRDAEIRREALETAINLEVAARLREIGMRFSLINMFTGMDYKGSAAVHVFFAPGMKEAHYVTQNCIDRSTEEIFASGAISELMRSVAKSYGHDMPKKRSGF